MSGFLRQIRFFMVFVVTCFACASGRADTTYTYTLNDDGAKVASVPQSFVIGSITELNSLPYKPGYGYGGHYTGRGCTGGAPVIDYQGNVQASINANTTLYACWRPLNPLWNLPSVVLDDDGGSGGAFETSCGTDPWAADVNGNNVSWGHSGDWAHMQYSSISGYWWTAPCNPSDAEMGLTAMATVPQRSGYRFMGYYTGPDGTGIQVVDANGNMVAASSLVGQLSNIAPTTIYAYWVSLNPIWATVTINDSDATTNSQYSTLYRNTNSGVDNCQGYRASQSCSGANITSFTAPTKTGYVYGGHFAEPNGAGSQWANSNGVIQYSIQDDQTVYAKWTPDIYEVELNHNYPTNSPSPSTVYLKYGQGWYTDSTATNNPIYSMVTKPVKTNYNFVGYYTTSNVQVIDADGNFKYTPAALQAITSNATVQARWMLRVCLKHHQ